jgi:hypothetical protein
MRRQLRIALTMMCVALPFVGHGAGADGAYPRTIVTRAEAKMGATTIASTITIQINRLVEAARRDRLIAGLNRNGYQGMMDILRPLPVIGAIKSQNHEVAVKYAWDTVIEGKHRLIIVADSPLFFLPEEEPKARPGYQLTVVQLLLDDRGAGTGLMAGAARVKPSPDEGIVLQDYATTAVELTVSPAPK